ncbi:hypothetical protein TSOC_007760 [Tetrabaena socialis]|uniref:Uncharacterized protein n=1 Tax=Tetrabaena socialis TaxID=47790 RepID=A0A2J8A0A2_9CHLO|nr:hypothetical protein TSOC_007760 [Tetrabaena socialis]|eukprot:PNH05936.1 hypothetical protein TSOC_007760 [Tetrabaena socialis]
MPDAESAPEGNRNRSGESRAQRSAMPSFFRAQPLARSCGGEERSGFLMMERKRVEQLVLQEFAAGLSDLSDEQLAGLLEDVLRGALRGGRPSSPVQLLGRVTQAPARPGSASEAARLPKRGAEEQGPRVSWKMTRFMVRTRNTAEHMLPYNQAP